MAIKQVPLTAEARNALASLAYAKWSECFDDLKKVKLLTWESSGKFCPQAVWPNFWQEMHDHAKREFDLASRVKAEICPFSPLVLGE